MLSTRAVPAHCCLYDSDTLAREARARPDALRAIIGRFERDPPLYYQMRITRDTALLATNPADLDKYDDVAVAYDRLGDDDSAIEWIEKKRSHLPEYDPHNPALKEQWYRYYANVGTFWMHRWAHHGADKTKLAEVKTASGYIRKAIDIKPNAHFGREKYQLIVMEWVMNPQGQSLADALDNSPSDEAVTALSGLIELGGAWQSFDVYAALSSILASDEERTHALGTLAALRAAEIAEAGGRSLHPETLHYKESDIGYSTIGNSSDFHLEYQGLRDEADRWQAARTEYMMARLKRGDHPDTDPKFWADYHPEPMPEIVSPSEQRKRKTVAFINAVFIGFVGIVVICALVLVRRWRRAARAA